ncbi:MAG: hypothetical protein PVJ38_08035 [Candidatus Bathyarchaeota archaeon]
MEGLRGLWETIRSIRHRSPQPKFCPKCKSANIRPKETFGIFPPVYKCKDCGYEGRIVIELETGNSTEALYVEGDDTPLNGGTVGRVLKPQMDITGFK